MPSSKSKTCRRKKYGWSRKFVSKSPFRTMKRAKQAERSFRQGRSVGFTARASLKSMGRVPRSSGCYILGDKYA
jgi:hypothetical protein